MAISSPLKFLFVLISLSFFASSTIAKEFSIVGYSPDDLTCIDKIFNLFESWIDKHGKIYKSIEEKLHRFEIFRDNLKHIDERNKIVSNYWLGLNEFADLSHEEFKNKFLGLKAVDQLPEKKQSAADEEFTYRNVEAIPKSVDWRKKGAVTPVKNQGQCGMSYIALFTIA